MTFAGLAPAHSCELCRTANYVETLWLRPIAATPGHLELWISSQLLTAKEPRQPLIRHRSIVPLTALVRLHDTLDDLLQAGDASFDTAARASAERCLAHDRHARSAADRQSP